MDNETLVLQTVDLQLVDAQRADILSVLLNYEDTLLPHEINTLVALRDMLDEWAGKQVQISKVEALRLDRTLSMLGPDRLPHWSEV